MENVKSTINNLPNNFTNLCGMKAAYVEIAKSSKRRVIQLMLLLPRSFNGTGPESQLFDRVYKNSSINNVLL